jgi:hypothetical protein
MVFRDDRLDSCVCSHIHKVCNSGLGTNERICQGCFQTDQLPRSHWRCWHRSWLRPGDNRCVLLEHGEAKTHKRLVSGLKGCNGYLAIAIGFENTHVGQAWRSLIGRRRGCTRPLGAWLTCRALPGKFTDEGAPDKQEVGAIPRLWRDVTHESPLPLQTSHRKLPTCHIFATSCLIHSVVTLLGRSMARPKALSQISCAKTPMARETPNNTV